MGHSSLQLHWISLPQMPSNVCSSPESSSGLLCLSLLNTGDKMVDETRGLVTSAFGDTRCRGYMCNFLTRMWPEHLHMQHLENRVTSLTVFFFFLRNDSNPASIHHLRTVAIFQALSQDREVQCQKASALQSFTVSVERDSC